MPSQDFFGLDRERKINKSRVRNVFTPHQPIHSLDLFFGRQLPVQKIIEQINTPGQHALLYGDRGVGKSSLANIAAKLLLKVIVKGEVYLTRCDSDTTFEGIISDPLKAKGIELDLAETRKSHRQGGKAGIKIPIADAGVESTRETTQTFRGVGPTISASEAARHIAELTGLLVIDEADALRRPNDRKKLAELIKLLSDSGSEFKLLVVGIARTGEELTNGHPSVQRCLKETKLGRMMPTELSQIVTEGAKKVKLKFEQPAVDAIVRLSAGYPHFTHLLALKCAEEAVAHERTVISKDDLRDGMSLAVEDAEGSLTRTYEDAIRSMGTDMYRHILLAAAKIGATEFTAGDLRTSISIVSGEPMKQNALNNYLVRLVSDGPTTVLRRTAKGVYCFNDPRMPSYIKIANQLV